MQATKCNLWVVWGMIQYIPGHGVQHILNSADHMGCVHYNETPCKQAGATFLY